MRTFMFVERRGTLTGPVVSLAMLDALGSISDLSSNLSGST